MRGVRPRAPRLLASLAHIAYLVLMVVRKRLNFAGPGLFFVTTSVTNWLPIFQSGNLARLVVEQLAETSRFFQVSVVGYVIMPSHFHGLLGLKNVPQLAAYVQAFKSLSSRRVKQCCGSDWEKALSCSGRFALWQRGFDDLLIHSQNQLRIKLEYIHNNPVKGGLAEEAVDYLYSSAGDWLGKGGGLVGIDRDFSWC